MHLTVAYMTNRMEPMIEWFFDSFHNECGGDYTDIRVVVVDFYADEPYRREQFRRLASKIPESAYLHVPPKPTVWQGRYRLTKQDYFAASNARNTALCLAPDGYIVYVDDLSVFIPGWLAHVRAAQSGNYIVCGAYQKVGQLNVVDGKLVSCVDLEGGKDHRLWQVLKGAPDLVPCHGNWFFGCSVAAPIEAFLTINGWDEDCDSHGAEDYPCGLMLEQNGYKLFYDPCMMTYESEEHHFKGRIFTREVKLNVHGFVDANHCYLNMVRSGRKYAPNYFGPGGLAALRQRILAGEPFPINQVPDRDWRDGQLISEM